MALSAAELIAAVEQSPEAARRGDRSDWVKLFTTDGRVEDPVGSRPHIGHDELGRFFDTFIGPRQIAFDRDADFVDDMTVIRDLTLDITMAPRVVMTVPAILRYVVDAERDGLKIRELQAYWNLPSMMTKFVRQGTPAVPVGLALARALAVNQRLHGSIGFVRGLRRPGRRHRAAMTRLLAALTAGDAARVRSIVPSATVDAGGAAARLRGALWPKVIAAGDSIAAAAHAPSGRAVVIADFGPQAEITRLQFFG